MRKVRLKVNNNRIPGTDCNVNVQKAVLIHITSEYYHSEVVYEVKVEKENGKKYSYYCYGIPVEKGVLV